MFNERTNTSAGPITACLIALALSGCNSSSLTTDSHTLYTVPSVNVHDRMDISNLKLRTAAATSQTDGNALTDGSFEELFKSGWDSCGVQNKISFTDRVTDGEVALELKRQGCVYQGVEINPNATVSLVCDAMVRSKRNDWTAIGISFYDEFWNYLGDAESAVVSGHVYGAYEVTAQAPGTALYASVWYYTENRALLDNCFLTADESESENLLYNGDFTINRAGEIRGYPVDLADGWRDACNGFNQRVSTVPDGEMVLSEGACVHQQLSAEAIQALEGNYFELTCTYNLTSDNRAIIATNLTDRRRETGMDEEIILTKTSTLEERLYGTATISGKASDWLDPALGVFVAIGKQGNDMLFIRDCSLRVVDAPLDL